MYSYLFTIIFLNLIILLLVFLKINKVLNLSKRFYSIFFLLLLMMFFNVWILLTEDVRVSISLLVFLSFFSMFLIIIGYGSGRKVLIVILFKSIGDVFIFIIISYIYFGRVGYFFTSLFTIEIVEYSFIFIFIIYSLVGLLGFWIYWAMEASYFISSYIHSCGFISIGVIFVNKFIFLRLLESSFIVYKLISFFSIFFYFIFILMFLLIKDNKKSFGFYSSSSICFLMFTSINYPVYGLVYFFLSSVIKILVFEVLFSIKKFSLVIWVCLFFISLTIVNYYLIFLVNSSSIDILFLIFIIKIFTIYVFFYKVILYRSGFSLLRKGLLCFFNILSMKFYSFISYKFLCLLFNLLIILIQLVYIVFNKIVLMYIYFKSKIKMFNIILSNLFALFNFLKFISFTINMTKYFLIIKDSVLLIDFTILLLVIILL